MIPRVLGEYALPDEQLRPFVDYYQEFLQAQHIPSLGPDGRIDAIVDVDVVPNWNRNIRERLMPAARELVSSLGLEKQGLFPSEGLCEEIDLLVCGRVHWHQDFGATFTPYHLLLPMSSLAGYEVAVSEWSTEAIDAAPSSLAESDHVVQRYSATAGTGFLLDDEASHCVRYTHSPWPHEGSPALAFFSIGLFKR